LNKESFRFLNNRAKNIFEHITQSGIHVDPKIIVAHFGEEMRQHIGRGNLMYTEYNLQTTTGRPSNRFGNLNFAALDKTTGIRAALTSRFGKDGMLVQFDYEAYHLRLIAAILKFKFTQGSIHRHLGEYYFGTKNLIPEQYAESKRISFQMLYGGVSDKYKDIPFFKEVDGLVKVLWNKFQRDGEIGSILSGRKLKASNFENMYAQKLFNYFVQMHETENNIMLLIEAIEPFTDKRSRMVLYTYDSILIDFYMPDGVEMLKRLKFIMEAGGVYPVKISGGKNYHEMHDLTDKF
jgi:hypothetical protein